MTDPNKKQKSNILPPEQAATVKAKEESPRTLNSASNSPAGTDAEDKVDKTDDQMSAAADKKKMPKNQATAKTDTNSETKKMAPTNTAVQSDGRKTKTDVNKLLSIPEIPDDLSSDVSSAPSLLDSTEDLDMAQRDRLYEQATQYQRRAKVDVSLKCYLRCLRGLLDPTGFTYLPQCLHRIADIYYEREIFDSAIQFIQAEKMYYETALVDTSDIQQKIETKKREMIEEGSEEVNAARDIHADKTDILRAHEYEELAKLCLRRKQPNLALEYQAKATKLRQDIYGENHEVTMGSLDFFAVVYAEVGKQKYTESMLKLGDEPLPTETPALTKPQTNVTHTPGDEQPKTERQRNQLTPEDEEWVSNGLLMILFFICSILLAVIGCYLYCRVYEGTEMCVSWKSDIHYYYMRFKYFFYHYTGSYSKKQYG